MNISKMNISKGIHEYCHNGFRIVTCEWVSKDGCSPLYASDLGYLVFPWVDGAKWTLIVFSC